jgi:glycosyltransferase involved in cell wall biosynthesis
VEPLLSVIIPSFRPGERITSCLDSLRRQQTDLGFEVIVVDSGDDGTAEVLESVQGIKLLRSHRRLFPGSARNLGVTAATGTVLCFTDADCLPAPDWIENIWKTRPDLNRTAVGGTIANGTPRSIVGTAEYFSEFSSFLASRTKVGSSFFPTANLSIGAGVFSEVGGFRNFEKGSDVAFGLDCRSAGIRPVYDPAVRVVHMNRIGLGEFLTNQEKLGWGAGNNRSLLDLPGSWLTDYPLSWPLIPGLRLARICGRAVLNGRGQRWNFVKSMPAISAGAAWFGAGFVRGVRDSSTPLA